MGDAARGEPERALRKTEVRCFATDSVEKFERLGSRFSDGPWGMSSWSIWAAECWPCRLERKQIGREIRSDILE